MLKTCFLPPTIKMAIIWWDIFHSPTANCFYTDAAYQSEVTNHMVQVAVVGQQVAENDENLAGQFDQ